MNSSKLSFEKDDNYYSAEEEDITIVIPFCGDEQHFVGKSPGDGWTKKKVKKTCQHRDKTCWVKPRVINVTDYVQCDDVVHISTKDTKTQPDDREGWIKRQVKSNCPHHNKTCWILQLSKKEIYSRRSQEVESFSLKYQTKVNYHSNLQNDITCRSICITDLIQ
jgi:hypothetical protein